MGRVTSDNLDKLMERSNKLKCKTRAHLAKEEQGQNPTDICHRVQGEITETVLGTFLISLRSDHLCKSAYGES